MSEWISVADQLPKAGSDIIVYGCPRCGGHNAIWTVMAARYTAGRHSEEVPPFNFEFGDYDCRIEVTHWMPLPNPPLGVE